MKHFPFLLVIALSSTAHAGVKGATEAGCGKTAEELTKIIETRVAADTTFCTGGGVPVQFGTSNCRIRADRKCSGQFMRCNIAYECRTDGEVQAKQETAAEALAEPLPEPTTGTVKLTETKPVTKPAVAPQNTATTGLTSESVTTFANEMAAASKRNDIDHVFKHFDPSAKITMIDTNGERTLTVDEYKKVTRQQLAVASKVSTEVSDIKVTVNPDGQSATITDVTTMSFEVSGENVSNRAKETVTVKLDKGQIRITNMAAETIP